MEYLRSISITAGSSPPSCCSKASTLRRCDCSSSATSPHPKPEPPPLASFLSFFTAIPPPEPPDPPDMSKSFRSTQIQLSPCTPQDPGILSPVYPATNPWYKPLNPPPVVSPSISHTTLSNRLILLVGDLAAVGCVLAKRGGKTLTFGETLTTRLSLCWAWTWPTGFCVTIGFSRKSPPLEIQQRKSAGVCDVLLGPSWTSQKKRASSLVQPHRGYSQHGVKPPPTVLWRWPRSLPSNSTSNWESPLRVSLCSLDLVIDIGDERLEGIVQKFVCSLVVLEFTSSSGRVNTVATIASRLGEWYPSIECKTRNLVSMVTRPKVQVSWSFGAEEDIRTVSVKSESLQMDGALSLGSKVLKLHGVHHDFPFLLKRIESMCCNFNLALCAFVTGY